MNASPLTAKNPLGIRLTSPLPLHFSVPVEGLSPRLTPIPHSVLGPLCTERSLRTGLIDIRPPHQTISSQGAGVHTLAVVVVPSTEAQYTLSK